MAVVERTIESEDISESILSVRDLKVYFEASRGLLSPKKHVKAVDGISFEIARGETLALVGESGCGKTTTARAIVRLVRPTGGKIFFGGADITSLSGGSIKQFRQKVQYIFQDTVRITQPKADDFRRDCNSDQNPPISS